MRIVIVGCGGIGGTVAACLSRAGLEVTAVTGNPRIARALAGQGYRVEELEGEVWSTPAVRPLVTLAERRSGEPPFDLCIVATQAPALEGALAAVLPHLASDAAVVCCQNGLPEERAAAIVGPERVVGCVVGWGATMIEPGFYRRTSRGTLQLGRPFAAAPNAVPIARTLEPASPTAVVPDLAAVRWSKLAINCATSTLGAVGGDALGRLLRHRFARRLALEVFAEVAEVARRSGIKPVPLAGTLDIERVAITPAERAQRFGSPSLAYKHSILLAVGMKYRRMRSSMLYAIERGRPPEIDYLNGELVRRAQALGIEAPVNAALAEAVQRIVRGEARSSLETLRGVHDAFVTPAVAAAA